MDGAHLYGSTDGGTTWIPIEVNAEGEIVVATS